MSVWEFFGQGRHLHVWPILFCSIVMLAIFGERLWHLSRVRLADEDLAASVATALAEGRQEQVR